MGGVATPSAAPSQRTPIQQQSKVSRSRAVLLPRSRAQHCPGADPGDRRPPSRRASSRQFAADVSSATPCGLPPDIEQRNKCTSIEQLHPMCRSHAKTPDIEQHNKCPSIEQPQPMSQRLLAATQWTISSSSSGPKATVGQRPGTAELSAVGQRPGTADPSSSGPKAEDTGLSCSRPKGSGGDRDARRPQQRAGAPACSRGRPPRRPTPCARPLRRRTPWAHGPGRRFGRQGATRHLTVLGRPGSHVPSSDVPEPACPDAQRPAHLLFGAGHPGRAATVPLRQARRHKAPSRPRRVCIPTLQIGPASAAKQRTMAWPATTYKPSRPASCTP